MKRCRETLKIILLCAIAALIVQHPANAQEPCAVPYYSYPLDSNQLPPLYRYGHALEFSATPALQSPRRAWVMRLDLGRGHQSVSLDVYVLRQQSACDSYEVERHWSGEISQQDYEAFNADIEPLIAPPHDLHVPPAEQTRLYRSGALDGTAMEVRALRVRWQAIRYLHHHTDDGRAISAMVRSMIARVVPPDEMPSDTWYTTGDR